MSDSFDAAVEDAIRENSRPRVTPPPDMVGTAPRRSQQAAAPKIRLVESTPMATATTFTRLGLFWIVSGLVTAIFLIEGVPEKIAFSAASSFSGLILLAIGAALDRLNEAAHWARQTADAIRQANSH